MERERMRGGGYRIFLSDEDLHQWGLDFASLDSRSPATRALLAAVLLTVKNSGEWEGEGMEVEALPVEGGCFLLLTPSAPMPRKLKLRRAVSPLIYRVSDWDTLYRLADAVAPSSEQSHLFAAVSLYAMQDGYRLIFYPMNALSAVTLSRLEEWGEPDSSGELAAAFVAEHGTAVFIGNALQRLYQRN